MERSLVCLGKFSFPRSLLNYDFRAAGKSASGKLTGKGKGKKVARCPRLARKIYRSSEQAAGVERLLTLVDALIKNALSKRMPIGGFRDWIDLRTSIAI